MKNEIITLNPSYAEAYCNLGVTLYELFRLAEAETYFNKGAEGRIFIPSPLGYGSAGAGGIIPPNAVLIFEIQVLDY